MQRQKKQLREKFSRVEAVKRLAELEDAIEHLRLSYEKYFRGVERIVPAREHERVERTLRLWEGTPPPGTQLRFRLQGLRARFITYNHYWNRILHQIEKGTYSRDLQRMARKQEAKQRSEPAASAADDAAPATEADTAAEGPVVEQAAATAEQGAVSQPPGANEGAGTEAPDAGLGLTTDRKRAGKKGERAGPHKRRQAAPQLPPGMTAGEARALFKELVEKKRAAGEKTEGLTYGALVSKLSKQVPKLKERHGDTSSFRFEVATDGGRVRLKAKRV